MAGQTSTVQPSYSESLAQPLPFDLRGRRVLPKIGLHEGLAGAYADFLAGGGRLGG